MAKIEKEYYNEELKKRYIKEKESLLAVSSNYIDVQFRKVSEMEREYEKDLSNWTLYEIVECYKLLSVSTNSWKTV